MITHLSTSLCVSKVTAASLISQALGSCIAITNTPNEDWDCIAALLCSFDIRNICEAMLAVQMVAMHYQTTALLAKAVKCDFLDTKEQYLKVALKLSKHYATQLEVLKKIRSKGEQTMVVKHVNIHSGAQAVVGQIEMPKGGVK